MTTTQQKRQACREFCAYWDNKELEAQLISFFGLNKAEQRAIYAFESHFRGVFINVSLLNAEQLQSVEMSIFGILTDKSLVGTHLYKKLADALNIKRKLQAVAISNNYSQLAESIISSIYNTREASRLEVLAQRRIAANAR